MDNNPFIIKQRTSLEKWLITITVMLVAVMEVLDMTIVNVSLRDMMGTFGATITQITWVITAYVVSSAVIMPLTGFLTETVGRRKLLLINIVGFMVASLLCGISTSLTEIIIFRALQGIFGACLIPLSQFIMRSTFEKKELGMAMTVWAMGIMIAPIMGPTLGGYITENLSWHWVFFINVPVCVIAFMMTLNLIEESPTEKKPVDFIGLILLAAGVGCLQTFLEEGSSHDWFSSNFILFLAITSAFCIAAFIIRSLDTPHPLIKLSIFKDRQFVSCSLIMVAFPLALFGMLTLQPLMVETVMNYPPDAAGWVMAPRGLASLLFMPFVPMLMKRFDARLLIAFGIFVVGIGTLFMTRWNLNVSFEKMAWESVIQGAGMAFVFAPLSTIIFDTLPQRDISAAAGMFSFGRNIGLSIGVAMFSTIVVTQTQVNWSRLGEHINVYNPNLTHWLQAQNLNLNDPTTPAQLANVLGTQASMIAYLNVYWLSALSFFVMMPLVLFIKHGRVANLKMGGAH